ncbi:MAG: MBL fold metallo-hydrolase [Phycisphaerales bacterium]|jgi:metallo-beta-lactamase family protein|nr:MBL fold metallo-hydrolase [Phycisphaerales bacterium]
MPKVELEFFGAAQTVTGSMHLLHIDDKTVSMDCGLFQGHRTDAAERNRKFPMRSDQISAVLLSHAHIDHSGKLPALVKHGFTGPIYATPATADLCEIMLADSAHIQEEDARFWNERRARTPKDHITPLYKAEDAQQACKQFKRVAYNERFQFADDSYATFLEAGHILGSACILVEIEGSDPVKLLYTGDLGRFDVPILRDPESPMPDVDHVITETTYANRRHHNPTHMKEELVRIINQTRAAGGKVVIPSFSVGRTQTVAYYLTQALHEGLIEPLPIYVDSPLSVNATEVFKKHPECYDQAAADFWQAKGDIFGKPFITYITDANDSKALNKREEPCVIIASSGMCEAGRIKHHLKNNVEDEANTVVIVGFMAQNTLGRRIVERREELKIYGRLYPLLCRVEILNGFSAHADRDELTRSLGPLAPKLKSAFCVHGEGPQPEAMKQIFHDSGCSDVHIPAPGAKFQLT